jgi:hypothetical protein
LELNIHDVGVKIAFEYIERSPISGVHNRRDFGLIDLFFNYKLTYNGFPVSDHVLVDRNDVILNDVKLIINESYRLYVSVDGIRLESVFLIQGKHCDD